jgi:3-isopropylmalate/(R)-2-methylmalate dehydratase small subunit
MSMDFEGRAYLFGANVNTDEIIPARYLNSSDPAVLATHCMEDARPDLAGRIEAGSLFVAGENFGCGSSREHAPIAIKAAGVSCVLAESFARIFFRNAINIGLPIVECPGVSRQVKEGDRIRVDLARGVLTLASGRELPIAPFPPFMEGIVREGGLLPFLMGARGTPRDSGPRGTPRDSGPRDSGARGTEAKE